MSEQDITECPADRLAELVTQIQAGSDDALPTVTDLVEAFPRDGRLHFLQGSLFAGARRYEEAHVAMQRAVDVAPGFAIARFQLGLLQLSSGNAEAAKETWGPLADLAQAHPLRLFSIALNHLAQDDLAQAIALLKEGISRNKDNAPLNRDMTMLLEKTQDLLDGPTAQQDYGSATQMLLRELGDRTRH